MSDAVTVSLFLVDKVLSFLQEELSRDGKVLTDVTRIKGHLGMMQACLQDAEGREGTSQIMRVLVGNIQDVAHEMEDVLDDFMIHAPRVFSATHFLQKGYEVCHHLKHRTPVQALQSKIASINARMTEITSSWQFQELVRNIVRPTESSHDQRYREEARMFEDDEIMGIDSPKGHLINLLTERSSRCKAISVVGPSGAGKTVLVSCVYKSKRVIGQFDCHAWLSLSHTNNHEQRLQNLLSQFCMGINELHFPLGADTAMKLDNYLVDKRYIVVLDGIRKDEEWSSIKRALPDRSNGSRMIITTQYGDVAARCASSDNHILPVKGLEWKDSWRLFCKKAYGNDSGECPPHLLDLSQMIVKRCEQLPQPISAVGTLLSRKPRLAGEWSRVNANLATEMQANCVNTMFLPSYYDLPSNQKSCLLYFSLFPEDYSIKRERLIRLWLSEGFVDKSGTVPPQKIAEDILNELISRNLVDASSRDFGSRDFRGRVKSCRVLNLMREFICQKSMEKKFAAVVTDRDMHQRDETIHRRLSIENASSSLRRRGGLHLDRVRSLFMFGLDRASTNMIAETLQRIRLLKVLDLENAPLDSFPECVLDAALLRYLSLRNTNVNKIPKTIERLRYLEYLDLKQTQVTCLPEEIFSLHYLQHLLVYHCNPMNYETFNRPQGVQIVGEMRVLPFIQKLSIIKADHNPRFFAMLGHHTQLKKLGLNNLGEKDGLLLCSCIENMLQLSTLDLTSSSREENLDLKHMNAYPAFLQHLYLKGRLAILPTWIPSLNGLVRLLLRWSKLNASPIEYLQHLPNLMELEMTDAFTGEVLFIDTGGFPKLRTLHIEQFEGLDTIVVCNGGLPMLRKLTIVRCMHLYDLPSGIEELKDLEELLLYDMPQHLTVKLGKNSEERWKIDHLPIIHSFYVDANSTWGFQNFS